MRSYVPAFDLRTPSSLDEALRLLASEAGRWRPFAGGTDLMVLLEAGRLEHREYVSLWSLPELRGIHVGEDHVTIGALATYAEIQQDAVLQRDFPLLCQAASETGGLANQNRGTLGGNIANASPAADSPPALLVYGAELELTSVRGTRAVPYERFHSGYKKMDLGHGEVIKAIRLPRPHGFSRQLFRKVGARRAQAISKMCFAGGLRASDGVVQDVKLAFASVAPTVVRARTAESVLRGTRLDPATIGLARRALARDIAPIDDLRSTGEYRREVAASVLEQFLSTAV